MMSSRMRESTSPPGQTQKRERCIHATVCANESGSFGVQCERVWKKATPLVVLTQQRGFSAHLRAHATGTFPR